MAVEVLTKTYGNKTIKIPANTEISVYKCPKLNCNEFYFSQDDIDHHRIMAHADMPKHLMSVTPNNGKYFNKNSMYKLNGNFQREHLKHTLLILNLDIEKVRKSLLHRIRRWLNARRNRA